MGGAQPLAITMNEGRRLIVEVDPERAERRRDIGYVDRVVDTLEEAMTLVEEIKDNGDAAVHRPDRQRRRYLPGTGDARRHPGCGHRPDLGPRSADVRPDRSVRGRGGRTAQVRPRRVQAAGHGLRWPSTSGHARLPAPGRGSVRLWQQPAPAGLQPRRDRRLRVPRLRPGLHPPAVLRGQGTVPLGGALRRPGRHLPHRRSRDGTLPRR